VTLSRKEVREITGFSFSKIGSAPENWIRRAKAFKDAAELIAKSDEYSPPIPFYYNSGVALELALKAIAIAKSLPFKTTHRLNDLCELIELKLTKDQMYTLELLSEFIVWSGRYPVPKKQEQWNNYHDVVQEKHIIREREGNVGMTRANRDRFPTLHNFSTIWKICEAEYKSVIAGKT
jgi:HEPN domain-containing protein